MAVERACGGDHRGAGCELDVQSGDGVALVVHEVAVGYPRAGLVLVAVDGFRLHRRVAHPGYLGDIAGERVYPVHLDEVLVPGNDGYAELLGVYLREVYVSPVSGAECAGDDRPAPCLGDCRAVGGRHPDHKTAVGVSRLSESGYEKPAGSDPDIIIRHIAGAVDVCRSVLCDGYSEDGAVGVQADEEVVPGQGRTVPDECLLPVRRGEGSPCGQLLLGKGAVQPGYVCETGPADGLLRGLDMGVLRPAAEDGAASRLPGRHLGGRAPESGECDGRKCFHVCKFIGQWSDSVFQNPCTKIRINR